MNIPGQATKRVQQLGKNGILKSTLYLFFKYLNKCLFRKLLQHSAVLPFTACTSGSTSQVMVDGRGGIQSPGYPYDVPEHLSCRWLLEGPADQVKAQFSPIQKYIN